MQMAARRQAVLFSPGRVVALLALCLLAQLRGARAYGTELSSTVSVFRFSDLDQYEIRSGRNATRCEHMVHRAGKSGATKVQFLVSQYFVDKDLDFVPEYFCYKDSSTPDCVPFSQAAIDRFPDLLAPCLRYAVQLGLHISMLPHINDGLNNGAWRNAQRINPLARYGGFSYLEAVLLPLAKALSAVITPTTVVWFAAQGEGGRMVVQYPTEHMKMLPYIKGVILAGRDSLAGNIRMGISTNANKLCGMQECQPQDMKQFVPANVQALYSFVDFIGLSSYPRYKGSLVDMEDSLQMLDRELQLFGIDLAKLVNKQGRELVFSEFGCGGGSSLGGDQPARTIREISNGPFFGVYGSYVRRTDPFRNYLPATIISGTRVYLHSWYAAAMLWLQRKGGPTWRVDHVFIWNLNSWDFQAVSPEATTKEGSYYDPMLASMVRSYNLRIRGMATSDIPAFTYSR